MQHFGGSVAHHTFSYFDSVLHRFPEVAQHAQLRGWRAAILGLYF
jgi:hypothetical protein